MNECHKITNAETLICVMSGNFVQRGEAAICDKYTRAVWAIKAGADIVIELPTVFALSPAPDFAYGAVKLLNAIPSVKHLCFGSESGDLNELYNFIDSLSSSDEKIKPLLKQGISFATASAVSDPDFFKSNNILGAEYIKSLRLLNSHITPVTIKRQGAGYNCLSTNDDHLSASSIRKLVNNSDYEKIKDYVPNYVLESLKYTKNSEDELFQMLSYMILTKGKKLSSAANLYEGLENRIISSLIKSNNLECLINNISTKRYPISKIKRILMCALLEIDKKSVLSAKNMKPYAKVLALKKGRHDILSTLSKSVKLIISSEDYKNQNKSIKTDILATSIYSSITKNNKLNDISSGLILV